MRAYSVLIGTSGLCCQIGLAVGLLTTASLSLGADAGRSQQLRVTAPIVGVEPITQGGAPVCDVAPPERQAGLAAALRWDLYGRCRPAEDEPQVTGYLVTYEWDGRRFETVLADAPTGDTLPLDLELDLN